MKTSTKAAIAIFVGIPFAGLGILSLFTIFLAPVGIALLLVSGYPLYRVIKSIPAPPVEVAEQPVEPWGSGEPPWFVEYEVNPN